MPNITLKAKRAGIRPQKIILSSTGTEILEGVPTDVTDEELAEAKRDFSSDFTFSSEDKKKTASSTPASSGSESSSGAGNSGTGGSNQ